MPNYKVFHNTIFNITRERHFYGKAELLNCLNHLPKWYINLIIKENGDWALLRLRDGHYYGKRVIPECKSRDSFLVDSASEQLGIKLPDEYVPFPKFKI